MKDDTYLWYRYVGRAWLDAHDRHGNLIKRDYWNTTDRENNAAYQRALERKSMKENKRMERRLRKEEKRDALRFDKEMRRT